MPSRRDTDPAAGMTPEDATPVIEVEPTPTVAGRVARWTERARILGKRVEAAREDHASVDIGFDLVERDSTVGGALFAGALAYRLFIVLLPAALLLVSGLGVYADTVDKSAAEVVDEAGLQGLVASEVAATASGEGNLIVFLVMLPVLAYAISRLYRAVAIVHAIAWLGSGRGVRTAPRGVGLLTAMLVLQTISVRVLGWAREDDERAGWAAHILYMVVVAAAWYVVSRELPHRPVRWQALVPGAVVFGIGLFCVNVFNVYVTTRMVEGRADTYGALGIAAALLFSFVIVGRLIVLSAVLNASLDARRRGGLPGPDGG